MAAANLFHLVQHHPLIDGNKRVGAAAANLFLYLNDIRFLPDKDEYTPLVLGVATGRVKKAETAEFLRANSRPLEEAADDSN